MPPLDGVMAFGIEHLIVGGWIERLVPEPHPSDSHSLALDCIVQGYTGAIKHTDVREWPPGNLIRPWAPFPISIFLLVEP